jgi:hypothetical protein
MSKTSIFGIVKSHSQAEQIVEGLQDAGFPASEISILLPDNEGKHDIGHVKATKAPEGATTGATAGGVTAECSVCSLASARLRSRESVHSSRPVLSWLCWAARQSERRQAA